MHRAAAFLPRAALAVALFAAITGCQTPRPREVDAVAGTSNVTLVRNQELIVNLEANATTGFRWLLQPRGDAVLEAVGEPKDTARTGDPRLVGAGGMTTYRFRALAAGRATLVFTYRRPWETNLPPAKSVRYEVTVE